MGLVLVGLSHRTAPLAIREKAAFRRDQLEDALVRLSRLEEIDEALVLSTCNRVEVLAHAGCEQGAISAIRSFLHQFHGLAAEELNPVLYAWEPAAAVRHIFRVACGLDSLVVGESQILGQLRDAYHAAQQAGSLGRELNRVMLETFHVAKKVRSEAARRFAGRSVSQAAVDLARQTLGDLQNRAILVVGAGRMSELTARHLHRAGARQVLVTNRTSERAVRLATRFQGEAVAFEDLEQALARSDIVISSAASPSGYLIRHAQVARALRLRGGKPILFIDVAVPRNVEPSVATLRNAHLCDIDGLAGAAHAEGPGVSLGLEQMVEEAAAAFVSGPDERELGPLISALRNKIESIGCAELDRHICKLTISSPADRERLELMVKRIGNKFLHPLIVELKRQAKSAAGGSDYAESLNLAFNASVEKNTRCATSCAGDGF